MSEFPPEVLTFGQPEQFQGWEYIPHPEVIAHPAYPHFFQRVSRVAQSTWAMNPKFDPRPYQCEAAALYCCRRGNICAGSQGVGKTLIVGFTICGLYPKIRQMRPGTVQIVAPSLLSAHSRWVEDLESIPALAGCVAVIANRRDWEGAQAPVWVYHRDFLTLKMDKSRRRPWLAQDLARHTPPCLLVVDEVHNFKPDSQRSKALFYLRSRSRRCLALSGTITDARLDLIQHTCRLVYGLGWPYSTSQEFRRSIGCKELVRTRANLDEDDPDPDPSGSRYLDFVALPKLGDYFQLLTQYIHRLTLDQAKVRPYCRVPKRRDVLHGLGASPAQYQAHRQLLQEHRGWIEQVLEYGTQKHIFSLFQPLLDLCWLPPEGTASAKFAVLRELVHSHPKTGVFVSTIESGRWLTQALEQEFGGQVVRLYAQDPLAEPKRLKPEQREQVLERLLFDSHIKVGVLSLNLASESIDLTQLSSVCFWGVNWSSLQLAQALARAVRPGSPYPEVEVHWLYHRGLLDEHQIHLLLEKMRAGRRLLDYDPYLSESEMQTTQEVKHILERLLT